MKFSLQWLNDFVEVSDFLDAPQKLSLILTQAGLEVEETENPSLQFQNIIVGQIKTLKKHPNADRLSLCEVEGEEGRIRQIVCGATNQKEGDKVVLALPGAVLPGDFKIKTSKIRGEESCGMLVSSKELGLEESSNSNEKKEEGIIILPSKAVTGRSYSEEMGFDDVIFDVNVTPNRSDCLSHLGLAREIGCLLNRPLKKPPSPSFEKSKATTSVKKNFNLKVHDMTFCPRYCGRLIEGVTIASSPLWLKKRLESVGFKSINNVVDVTNYILMELGQPLHGFDRDKIRSVSVDNSLKGEKFTALDGEVLTLTGEELTIRDGKKAIALAGVIGGESTAISPDTKNVFIEAAFFLPEKVRRTARHFGLETESAYRFSRGIDESLVLEAMKRACSLIQKIAGGEVSQDFFDEYPKPFSPSPISIQMKDLEERLGYKPEASSFVKWMKGLNCEVREEKDVFTITPPSFRRDLTLKEDLMEETARLEGYHKVPLSPPRGLSGSEPLEFDNTYKQKEKINHVMESEGWYQLLNYSFGEEKFYEEFLKEKESLHSLGLGFGEKVLLQNPLSSQLALMKPLLAPDIFKTLTHNLRHNNKSGEVFETAPVFFKEEESFKQKERLGLACWGQWEDLWSEKKIPNLFRLKSALEFLFSKMNIKGYVWDFAPPSLSFIHPEQMLGLKIQGKAAGFIGTLHPTLKLKYKIPLDVALGEMPLDLLKGSASLKTKPLPELLPVERDLTFLLPTDLPAGKIVEEIKKLLPSSSDSVQIIALYKKEKERAVSFRLSLNPKEKPWTDKELLKIQDHIVKKITTKFSVSLK